MAITFDADKNQENIAKHQISLARAADLEILATLEDDRFDYGEVRFRAWGLIDDETYCLVFTIRDGDVRAISLRRAHDKEMRRYVLKPTD